MMTNVIVSADWQNSVRRSTFARLLLLCHSTESAPEVAAAARDLTHSVLNLSGLFESHGVYDQELAAEQLEWVRATRVQDGSILLIDTLVRFAAAWNSPLCNALADKCAGEGTKGKKRTKRNVVKGALEGFAGSVDLPVEYDLLPSSPVITAALLLSLADLSLFIEDLPKQVQANVQSTASTREAFLSKFTAGFAVAAAM